MHIKDHSAAMKFFRTYDNVASKGKWKEFVDEMEFDSMLQEPRATAQDPRIGLQGGQLVQPGVGRQGYGGKYENTTLYKKREEAKEIGKVYDRKTKKFREKKLPPQAQLSPENLKKWNIFQKSKDFRKLVEDNKHLSKWDLMDMFSRKLSRKDKVIGIKGLMESLGGDNPYSYDTLHNGYKNAQKKITKNMSNQEKSVIRSSQKIWNIINETLGEPTTGWAVQRPHTSSYVPTGESPHKMWSINKSQIKKLNKALNKNRVRSITPNTIENVYKLLEDEDLMKALDTYQGGKIDESHPILKAILKGEQPGARIHAFTALGEALKGDIELEGISKNLKRGNKIIKSLHGNYGGPLGNQLLKWAKRQMAKHFDDPNATYTSLVKTMRTALNDAGLNHLAVDEIFPARTGQISIGKGSGAYNQIIQFIDQDINMKEKKYFDARAGKRYKGIIEARKDKNWERVNKLVKDHEIDISDFYEDNPQAKGKVKLTQLKYDPKTHKFASPTEIYGKDIIPSKILKGMEKFQRKTGLSLDVGSTKTLEKAAADIKKNPAKFLQKLGYGRGCKASGGRVGFANAGDVDAGQMKCIMSDVEKTKADMKSSDVTVRAKALTKQRKALQLASKIRPLKKILKTGIQMGTAAITKPLEWLGLTSGIGYAIEGIVEGGFYDNARRKGYSHEQAMAETFTPGLIAGRPEDVPWYGGAEKLREKELIGDVQQNPKVAQYVDALKEQDRIYEAIGAKEEAKADLELAETGFDATLLPGDLDAASADVQDLARSGAYRRVDKTLAPESMASQAYNTAVEKQQGLDQRRRTEYLEKVEPAFLEREQKSFDTKRHREKRYQEMDEMFPDYSKEDIDYILKNMWGTSMEELGEGYTYEI